MLNKVTLIGNLGADPEVKSFQNGGRVANLRIATTEKWKDRQTQERKERTEWHSVAVANDGLVGVVEQYLRKGSKVYIEGQLRTRKWQDRDGNDRYSTEVVLAGMGGKLIMLDSGGEDRGSGGRSSGGGGRGGGQRSNDQIPHDGYRGPAGGGGGQTPDDYKYDDDMDDDVPF